MRNSKKRNKIISFFSKGDLLTAAEVSRRLKDVDRATVYRNLALLTSEGILREVNLKKGISSYEINKEGDHHQHFICDNCEKVIPVDVDINVISKIVPAGVELDDFELNLKGKCTDCK